MAVNKNREVRRHSSIISVHDFGVINIIPNNNNNEDEPIKLDIFSLNITPRPSTSPVDQNKLLNRIQSIPGLGLMMAFMSGIFFATAGFTVGMMGNIDACFIVVVRSMIQIIFFLPFSITLRQGVLGIEGERSALFQRAFFGFICFSLSYYALSYVSYSDASAIAFSSPVFVAVIACVVLREPCGLFQIITVGVTIIGVFLVARPEFLFGSDDHVAKFDTESRMIGVGMACITSITMAYTFICMRKLIKTGTLVVINFFSMFCIFFGVAVMLFLYYVIGMSIGLPTTRYDWMWILFNGLCGVGGQFCLVMALKLETAGLVSLARTFDIVIAFMYQVFILEPDYPPHPMSIVGAVIVCSGCIAVGLKKWIEAKPEVLDKMLCRKSCPSDELGHGHEGE